MRHVLNFIVMSLVLGAAVSANAATWHVVPAGGGDATTIQAGINLAADGDIVMVAAGTYTGTGNVNVSFNGKNITVQSESGPGQTIIDCQQAAQGFKFITGETSSAMLYGFTIKNARANKGAGIQCDGSSPLICWNVISGCYAFSMGGGIYTKKGSPVIFNNTLDGNGAAFGGGGIALASQSNAQVYQNIICGTTAGGAFVCSGASGGTFVSCNDLYGNTGGQVICVGNAGQNYSMDPLFCGIPGSGNFYLQMTSPCSQNFSPCGIGVGALGVLCQVTATQPVTWGRVKSLYR